MKKVSQANLKIIGGGSNGQSKLITYLIEMPVPYRFYIEISEESIVWEEYDPEKVSRLIGLSGLGFALAKGKLK